ncbi:hypothetical protein [Sphingopyxis sp. NJF-3]
MAAPASWTVIAFIHQMKEPDTKLAQPDNVGKAYLTPMPALGWGVAVQDHVMLNLFQHPWPDLSFDAASK